MLLKNINLPKWVETVKSCTFLVMFIVFAAYHYPKGPKDPKNPLGKNILV